MAPEIKPFDVPSPSLDGRQVAVAARAGTGDEQWILDLATGAWSRPSQSGTTSTAQWVPPDGQEILFYSNRVDEPGQVFVQPADRSGPAERLWPSEDNQSWLDVSPHGRYVLLISFGREGFSVLDREQGELRSVVESGIVYAASFHPDGDWIVYSRQEQGASQLWLAPFPGPGEPRQLTSEGGQEPRWSPSGDEIFYRSPTHLMAIPVERSGAMLRTGRPEILFEDRFRHSFTFGIQNYSVHPDGRFIMIEGVEADEKAVILVQNWGAKVERAFAEGGGG